MIEKIDNKIESYIDHLSQSEIGISNYQFKDENALEIKTVYVSDREIIDNIYKLLKLKEVLNLKK